MKRLGALLSSLVILVGCGIAQATTDQVYQENNFIWNPTAGTSVVDNSMQLTKNTTGTITGPTGQITNIRVRAKGIDCVGWPNMRVTLNGTVLANQQVPTATFVDYNFPVSQPAGMNQLQISFTNEFANWWFWVNTCNRTLFVDSVTVTVNETTPTTTTTTTTTTPPVGGDYVAMGDSYSVGWGSGGPYDSCGRTNNAAPHGLSPSLNLIFGACGGTSTQHMLDTSYNGEPPQLSRITPTTQLETFTIGGNDAGLLWMLEVCIKQGNCVPSDFFGGSYINQMNDKINALQAKIEAVLRKAVQNNPTAKIRPAGYPYILPAVGQPIGSLCTAWLTTAEQAMFADATIRTNNEIRDAVGVVKLETGADIVFVDPMTSFPLGKDGCTTVSDKYMVGTEIALGDGGWHPTVIGQQLYRAAYAATL